MGVIAVGGFQHETNTFAPSKADYAAFEDGRRLAADHVRRRDRAPPRRRQHPGHRRVQALHAAGHRDARSRVGRRVAVGARHARCLRAHRRRDAAAPRRRRAGRRRLPRPARRDGHRASRRRRRRAARARARVVGPHVPIVASLDLHANVTRRDDRARRRRWSPTAPIRTSTWRRPASAPPTCCSTLRAPRRRRSPEPCAARLPDRLSVAMHVHRARTEAVRRCSPSSSASDDTVLSFTPGFPMADFPECGMAVFGYGPTRHACRSRRRRAAHARSPTRRAEFALDLVHAGRRGRRAMQRGAAGAPVVLADTQDNPGAGGNGDTTGLLAALLRARRARCGAGPA